MYVVVHKNNKYKVVDKNELLEIDGFMFGTKGKSHKINDEQVANLVICNKQLAYPIAYRQVEKKYKQLREYLTDLLVSDDDSGDSIFEVLNQIEKFRQIIKNKYRLYLKRKEIEQMSKELQVLKKEAELRLCEIQEYFLKNTMSRSSSK